MWQISLKDRGRFHSGAKEVVIGEKRAAGDTFAKDLRRFSLEIGGGSFVPFHSGFGRIAGLNNSVVARRTPMSRFGLTSLSV